MTGSESPRARVRLAGHRAGFAVRRVREVYAVEGAAGVARKGRHWIRKRYRRAPAAGLPRTRISVSATTWPLAVLSVAERSIPQCYHYRVTQKREILSHLGIAFDDVGLDDLAEARSRLQLAALVIVYRLPGGAALDVLVEEAHRLRIPVVFEVDDLVYRRDVTAANPNLDTLPPALRDAVIRGSDGYRDGLRTADVNLASTGQLADDMRSINGRPGFIVENGIDDEMLAVAAALTAEQRTPVDQGMTLLYGSGSRAHDHDFAVAAAGIARWLQENPGGRLRLIGPVRLPPVLHPVAGQILRTNDHLPYGEYLRHLHASTIALAPLADEDFNRFKSHVKYLESGLVRTPVIASPTVYSDYVRHGTTGMIAGPGQWYETITAVTADTSLRQFLSDNARDDVRRWELRNEPSRQMQTLLDAVIPSWRSR